MPRKVTVGLIQTHNPVSDPKATLTKVQKAAMDLHLKLIHEAGKKGVQILGLQEIFNGPYFCPSQDAKWYDAAESVPGPTTEAIAKVAKKYRMAVVVPVYEREDAGVYYNTAAVYDSDGTSSASTGRTTSRTRRASGRSTSSSRATSDTPCSRRCTASSVCTSATTATFPKARASSA